MEQSGIARTERRYTHPNYYQPQVQHHVLRSRVFGVVAILALPIFYYFTFHGYSGGFKHNVLWAAGFCITVGATIACFFHMHGVDVTLKPFGKKFTAEELLYDYVLTDVPEENIAKAVELQFQLDELTFYSEKSHWGTKSLSAVQEKDYKALQQQQADLRREIEATLYGATIGRTGPKVCSSQLRTRNLLSTP